jgi:hypothetical protein
MSRTRTGYTGVTGRILITALDASGLIVGAFLNWTRDTQGTHVSWRSLYQDTFGAANNIVQSVGGLSILVGLVAVLGLAESSGWLTRLAEHLNRWSTWAWSKAVDNFDPGYGTTFLTCAIERRFRDPGLDVHVPCRVQERPRTCRRHAVRAPAAAESVRPDRGLGVCQILENGEPRRHPGGGERLADPLGDFGQDEVGVDLLGQLAGVLQDVEAGRVHGGDGRAVQDHGRSGPEPGFDLGAQACGYRAVDVAGGPDDRGAVGVGQRSACEYRHGSIVRSVRGLSQLQDAGFEPGD